MITLNNILGKVNTPIAVAVLVCATMLVYAGSLKNSFVCDDASVIAENDFVKSWTNFPRLFDKSYLTKARDLDYVGERDIGSGELSYRPVVTLSYFADYAVWKLNPAGYHLVNIILHICNSIVLFMLIRRIAGNTRIALLTALFFALHPVNAEAVAVISFREDLFVFLFSISALILYIKSREAGGGRAAVFYGLSLCMFLCALFSKESAIIFPVVLLCYDRFFNTIQGNFSAHFKKYYPGYVCILLFYAAVRFILINNADEPIAAHLAAGLYTNLFTMFKVFAAYIQWFLLPFNIHPTLPDDPLRISHSLSDPAVLWSMPAVLALLVVAVAVRKKMRYFSFGVFWFFIALIPVSNILFPLINFMAARYLYLPIAGLCFVTAVFFVRVPDIKIFSIPPRIIETASLGVVMILLMFYSLFTVIGTGNFKNNAVFWLRMVEIYPDNALAHSNAAFLRRKEGAVDKAITEYKIALNLNHDSANDHNALGVCYYEQGMPDEAMQEYNSAITLDPGFVSAYYNLGRVYDDKGLFQKAIGCFEKAIQLDGKCLNAYNDLGIAYAHTGNFGQAKKMWEKVIQLDPRRQDAQKNLEAVQRAGY